MRFGRQTSRGGRGGGAREARECVSWARAVLLAGTNLMGGGGLSLQPPRPQELPRTRTRTGSALHAGSSRAVRGQCVSFSNRSVTVAASPYRGDKSHPALGDRLSPEAAFRVRPWDSEAYRVRVPRGTGVLAWAPDRRGHRRKAGGGV